MRISLPFLIIGTLLLACGSQAQTVMPQLSSLRDDPRVTPVTGESWLIHLNRSFNDTSMGKTARLGPRPEDDAWLAPPPQVRIYSSNNGVALRGSDLYRLNCQGCHGDSGLGAPPEINSVINPVRATSVPLVLARVKAAGMEMSYSDAAKLAQQSKAALLDRLHKGGESMPAFSHLNDAEIHALLAYLNHLAGVPGAANDSTVVKESQVRVGELIVKSTCHTCHSATGPDPGPVQMFNGAIPPLSALPARKGQAEFIRKVTQGAPVLMGSPPMLCRGRMPVFFYLSQDEASDVYLYLALYPPTERKADQPLVAALEEVRPTSSSGPGAPPPVPVVKNFAGKSAESAQSSALEKAALPLLLVLVTFVLAGGLIFTLREFKRLSGAKASHAAMDQPSRVGPGSAGQLETIEPTTGALLYNRAKRSSQ